MLIEFLAQILCSEYDSQERSASEVKQEIERHLKDKETLENSLPSSIVIGPYWISTEGVKQALAKKRKALANAVIELLAKKLRKQADMVGNAHKSVFSLGNTLLVITFLFVKEPMLACFFYFEYEEQTANVKQNVPRHLNRLLLSFTEKTLFSNKIT